MPKHTPGQWHAGSGNSEGSVFADEGRTRLTGRGTTLWAICTVHDFEGEREANAKLIAASPELLAALQRTLDAVSSLPDEAREQFDESAVEQAIAAIAKAT